MRPHVLLNARVRLPLLHIAFISSGVQGRIRKESTHLPNKSGEKFIRTFACRIDCRTVRGISSARQVRVAEKPRCCMAGHIKLWAYSDTAVASVRDNVPDFVLRVIKAARALLL